MTPDIVRALVKTIEMKDACTAAHTWRVTLYARAMAERLYGNAPPLDVTQAAALHDVGKIDIPDRILRKPGRLTDEEFEVIKSHTTLGHERLVRMGEDNQLVLDLVRHHHERWDGLGYPDGLAGEDIPVSARIFGVIDTFDALTSIRPYRSDVGEDAAERAMEELERCAGSRYWPEGVKLFRDLYASEDVRWILHHFNDRANLEIVTSREAIRAFEDSRRTT